VATKIYENWLSKIHECGMSTEQACGFSMLLAWNLTSKNNATDYDPDIYWKFIEKSEFDSIIAKSFVIDDFLRFIPILKLAGELLWTEMPESRLDSENNKTELLNLDWRHDLRDKGNVKKVSDVLMLRHRFDLLWCQKLGESLRPEIRNPIHAFAFVEYLTHGFAKFDPEGYSSILNSILIGKSPFAAVFSSRFFVMERNGLEGHEPFQIALLGFMANQDPKLGEQLWNLQRILFYKQPGGEPVNLDKQFLSLTSFLRFYLQQINDFIDLHRDSFLDLSKLVAAEYLYRSSDVEPIDQFLEILEKRYGFNDSEFEFETPTAVLINAAAFYTTCCLKIRNLTNQINKLPTLKSLDEFGFIWTRDITVGQTLRDEAILCFEVMLSWRWGASWALFIETKHGFFQRAYVGDTSNYSDVDNLFSELCIAYSPVKCIVCFWTHRQLDAGSIEEEVVFLNLIKNGVCFAEIFQGRSDVKIGRSLGDFIGTSEDPKLISSYFPKLQNSFMFKFESEFIETKQDELIDLFPPSRNWNFVNRLEELDRNDGSVTYVDLESASHDEYLTSLWLLIDYSSPQMASEGIYFCSTQLLCEYDCKNKTRKFVTFKMYDLPMGAGSCVHNSGEINKPASPVPSEGNVGYKAWKIACKLNPLIEVN
jgi:hypothetical protein